MFKGTGWEFIVSDLDMSNGPSGFGAVLSGPRPNEARIDPLFQDRRVLNRIEYRSVVTAGMWCSYSFLECLSLDRPIGEPRAAAHPSVTRSAGSRSMG